MSKVIAIMDKPKNCQVCVFGICKYSLPLSTRRKGYYCQLKEPQDRVVEDFDFDDVEIHLSNCPLREIPEKKDEMKACVNSQYSYAVGYNACIDEIFKGCESDG